MGHDDALTRGAHSHEPLESRSSFDRREVLAGFVASTALGLSSAAADGPRKPNIQIVRHPQQPGVFGVGIVLPDADDANGPQSYALFPMAMASGERPQGRSRGSEATNDLDGFAFNAMAVSTDDIRYHLEFIYTEKDRALAARLTRKGSKPVASSRARLDDVLAGKAGLVFDVPIAAAEPQR